MGLPLSSSSSVGAPAKRLDLHALFQAHYGSTWRLLRRFGVRPAQLDDATQEVFWVAARRLADIQPGREKAFLYGVALRVASGELRAQKSSLPMADLDTLAGIVDRAPSPEERLDQQRARLLLDWVLERMPIDLRTVFVLFELEGLDVREIAALEKIPVGTAGSRLRRAREEFSSIAGRVRAAMARQEGNRP